MHTNSRVHSRAWCTLEYQVCRHNFVAETGSTGAVTEEVLWGHQPFARKTNGNWYYIYNEHGDVVGLVDDLGMVVNSYEYTPWGKFAAKRKRLITKLNMPVSITMMNLK